MLPRGSYGTLAPVPRETGAFPSINARALICVDLAPSARPISDLCGHGAPVRCGRGFCLWEDLRLAALGPIGSRATARRQAPAGVASALVR